jgi:glycosyltransferase involved in cell wall biosynthesis
MARMPGTRISIVGVVLEPARWQEDLATWKLAGAEVHATTVQSVAAARWFLYMAATLPTEGTSIVHAHGIWTGGSLGAGRLAERCQCPLVISPHGMLEPWAFTHRRRKKAIPWMLWERRVLVNATLLQAMSDQEADAIADRGLHNPVAVHGIGLDLDRVVARVPRKAGQRTCLFLSRIHPKKGLPMLLHAWASLRPRDWRLVIAGPDEGGHLAELQSLATRLEIVSEVDFIGPVYGDAKWRLLAQSDLFILPSHSENFGIVVAEAMAAGLPAIATVGTPWRMLQEEGLGWWVPPTVTAIEASLGEALTLPPHLLEGMGQKAAVTARQRFNWPAIAAEMRAAYSWAIAGGEPPACVRFPGVRRSA